MEGHENSMQDMNDSQGSEPSSCNSKTVPLKPYNSADVLHPVAQTHDLPHPFRPEKGRTATNSIAHPNLLGNENGNPLKSRGRGKSFSEEEMLCLAKAWITQSQKGANQNERTMWSGIESICRSQYNMNRTANSLRSTWRRVAREAQHFIAARMRVRAMNISGANDDMIEQLAQEQYRKKAGRKNSDGSISYATPFKWTSTADFLSEQDKCFDGEARKAARRENKNKRSSSRSGGLEERDALIKGSKFEDEGAAEHGGVETRRTNSADVSSKRILFSSDEEERPLGIKRRKVEDRRKAQEGDLSNRLREMQELLAEGNNILLKKLKQKEVADKEKRDIELLKLLERGSEQFNALMKEVMDRRKEEQM